MKFFGSIFFGIICAFISFTITCNWNSYKKQYRTILVLNHEAMVRNCRLYHLIGRKSTEFDIIWASCYINFMPPILFVYSFSLKHKLITFKIWTQSTIFVYVKTMPKRVNNDEQADTKFQIIGSLLTFLRTEGCENLWILQYDVQQYVDMK